MIALQTRLTFQPNRCPRGFRAFYRFQAAQRVEHCAPGRCQRLGAGPACAIAPRSPGSSTASQVLDVTSPRSEPADLVAQQTAALTA